MELCPTEKSVIPKDSGSLIEDVTVRPGDLDGLTIMRHAPFYRERSNGGVEQCLRCLNLGLLQRHRMTVLQVYRVNDIQNHRIEVEEMGKGRILWVPVSYQRTATRFADLPRRTRFVYEQTLRRCQQDGEGMQRAVVGAAKAVLRRRFEDLRHRSVILSDPLSQLLLTHKVNLLALHGLTYDAEALICHAKRADIPYVLVSHFDNGLFSEPHVRTWLFSAAGIASVSGRGLPADIGDRCVNLSDGINTEFFTPEKAAPQGPCTSPAILMPALIKPGKGQKDLLQAAQILTAKGIDFTIYFAGAVESGALHRELREFAAAAGLESRVFFLGELSQEGIRNYYALCSVVVLPSYTEGLPRTLLEAQAMQRPVVAYDSSRGIGEAFVPDKSGFLVTTGDIDMLADRLGLLLENDTQRLRMGERGREFVVQKFSASALVERHEAFYLRALRNNGVRAFDKERAATLQG